MSDTNTKLRDYVTRIEDLQGERADVGDSIKDEYEKAASDGFDKKILRKVIAARRKSKIEREQEDSLLTTYLNALENIGNA